MYSVQSSLYFCYQLLPSSTLPDGAPATPAPAETAARIEAAVQPSTALCHSRFSRPAPSLVLVHCASTLTAAAARSSVASSTAALLRK